MLGELPGRTGKRRCLADEGEVAPLRDLRRAGLIVTLDQLRLLVKHVEVRWSADHMEVDDVLRARREVRPARRRLEVVVQQRGKRDSSKPDTA